IEYTCSLCKGSAHAPDDPEAPHQQDHHRCATRDKEDNLRPISVLVDERKSGRELRLEVLPQQVVMTFVLFLKAIERLQLRPEIGFLFRIEIGNVGAVGKLVERATGKPLVDILSDAFNSNQGTAEGIQLGFDIAGKYISRIADVRNSGNERLFPETGSEWGVCRVLVKNISSEGRGERSYVVVQSFQRLHERLVVMADIQRRITDSKVVPRKPAHRSDLYERDQDNTQPNPALKPGKPKKSQPITDHSIARRTIRIILKSADYSRIKITQIKERNNVKNGPENDMGTTIGQLCHRLSGRFAQRPPACRRLRVDAGVTSNEGCGPRDEGYSHEMVGRVECQGS